MKNDYTQLPVWQRAHELTLAVYELTRAFPVEETYEQTAQLRRGAATVPASIAQACAWDSAEQATYYLHAAAGSVADVQYRLMLARDLGYLSEDDFLRTDAVVSQVQEMITHFVGRVQENAASESRHRDDVRDTGDPEESD